MGLPIKCICRNINCNKGDDGDRKIFYRSKSIIKRGGGKYCSVECQHEGASGANGPRWKGGKVKCICQNPCCDKGENGERKEFYNHPSTIKMGYGKYCSRECYYEHAFLVKHSYLNIKEVKCICKNHKCNKGKDGNHKIFYRTPLEIKRGLGKYCSDECQLESQKKRIKCICQNSNCNKGENGERKEFEILISQMKHGDGIYCSRECQYEGLSGENSPHWKGGVSFEPYCPKFNMRRKKAVRDFFNNTCLACGKLASENIAGPRIIALCVHHADHDKEQGCNGKPFNLVPLCHDCHGDEFNNQEEYRKYINKTLEEGFKWGIWNEEEYIRKVMYPDD